MNRVFVCSPYRGDVWRNIVVAQELCRRVLLTGSAPFAPHLLYPQILDDTQSAGRECGLEAGLSFLATCNEVWVYSADGISEGMRLEIGRAKELGIPIRMMPEKLDLPSWTPTPGDERPEWAKQHGFVQRKGLVASPLHGEDCRECMAVIPTPNGEDYDRRSDDQEEVEVRREVRVDMPQRKRAAGTAD